MSALTIAIVDANEASARRYAGIVRSVVGGWLTYEAQRAGLTLSEAETADLILLVFAGAVDWERSCHAALRRRGIEPDAARRRAQQRRPYIIAGGPVDATPFTALRTADAVAIGEAVRFVRILFDMLRRGASLDDVRRWIIDYPHAIERSQIEGLERDAERPWLLQSVPPVLATPDDYVDWDIPPVRSDDKVVRIIAEKGCHCKCLFCATTYRQTHRQDTNERRVLGTLRALKLAGERVQLVSNDPMNLPYFRRITTRLDSQSFTIMEVSDDENRAAIIRSGVGIARFGLEGASERLRRAFAKPISNERLLRILDELHRNKVNTHLFLIGAAPYETEADWEEFRQVYAALTRVVTWGICRIKFTTFLPTPPAPLARFVVGETAVERPRQTQQWITANAASRHMFFVAGRRGEQHIRDVADQLSIPITVARQLCSAGETVDLAPTLDDARRLPWEVIAWPLSVEQRWQIGAIYARRLRRGA